MSVGHACIMVTCMQAGTASQVWRARPIGCHCCHTDRSLMSVAAGATEGGPYNCEDFLYSSRTTPADARGLQISQRRICLLSKQVLWWEEYCM